MRARTDRRTWRTDRRRSVSGVVIGLLAVAGLMAALAPTGGGKSSASAGASADPEAMTSYSYTSDPDDFIGAGGSGSFRAPIDRIRVSGTAEFLTVRVSDAEGSWTIDLAAPRGETLRPGVYHDAERAALRTGRAPGLDASGEGRGCGQVAGSFAIDQFATDDSGAITRLGASFTQSCGRTAGPALKGTVAFDAHPLSYGIRSDAGDPVGQGRSVSYTGATSVFGLSRTGRGTGGDDSSRTEGVDLRISGRRDTWTVGITAPEGRRLEAGRTYRTTRRGGGGAARLDAVANGRGCTRSTGELTVTKIRRDKDGISGLAATFAQTCEGAGPALRGTVHYFA